MSKKAERRAVSKGTATKSNSRMTERKPVAPAAAEPAENSEYNEISMSDPVVAIDPKSDAANPAVNVVMQPRPKTTSEPAEAESEPAEVAEGESETTGSKRYNPFASMFGAPAPLEPVPVTDEGVDLDDEGEPIEAESAEVEADASGDVEVVENPVENSDPAPAQEPEEAPAKPVTDEDVQKSYDKLISAIHGNNQPAAENFQDPVAALEANYAADPASVMAAPMPMPKPAPAPAAPAATTGIPQGWKLTRGFTYWDFRSQSVVGPLLDVWAAKQASGGEYNIVWCWIDEQGHFIRLLTGDEILMYTPR